MVVPVLHVFFVDSLAVKRVAFVFQLKVALRVRVVFALGEHDNVDPVRRAIVHPDAHILQGGMPFGFHPQSDTRLEFRVRHGRQTAPGVETHEGMSRRHVVWIDEMKIKLSFTYLT